MTIEGTRSSTTRPTVAREWLFPVVGALVSCAVWFVGAGKELWYSERFVQALGDQSWSTMFSLLRFENNPPLFFIIARCWESLVGRGEVALRTLPLFFFVASVVAVWHTTKQLAGRYVARYAVLIVCVSGTLIQQATEYRMYTLLLLCSVLAIRYAWNYRNTGANHDLVALCILNTIGFYTHYTYLILAAFLMMWLFSTNAHNRKRLVVSIAFSVASWIPWVVYAFGPLVMHPGLTLGIQQQSASPWELVLLPFRIVVPPVFGEPTLFFTVRLMACAVIVVGFCRVCRTWKRQLAHSDYRTLILFLSSGIAFAVVCLSLAHLTLTKYATAFVPFVIVLLALGVSEIMKHRIVGTAVVGAVGIVSLLTAIVLARQPYVTYREAAAVVAAQEQNGDLFFVYPFNDEIAVRPYYEGGLLVSGFFPLKVQQSATLADNIRYNFLNTLDDTTVNTLSEYVGNASRIWCMYDVPIADGYFRANLIDEWFLEHGFSKTVYRDVFHNVPPLLVRYERNT